MPNYMAWSLIRKGKIMFSLRKLPCDCEVRGHCKCKEMPVISVNRVVDKKRIIGKNGRAKEEERQKGSLTQKWPPKTLRINQKLTLG
jgi:hypothetical protein